MIIGSFNKAVVLNDKKLGSTAQFLDLLNTRMVEDETVSILKSSDSSIQNPLTGYTQTYFNSGLIDPDIFKYGIGNGILLSKYNNDDNLFKGLDNQIINIDRKLLLKKFSKYLKKELEKVRSLWPEFANYTNLGEIDKYISDTTKRLKIKNNLLFNLDNSFVPLNIFIGKDLINNDSAYISIVDITSSLFLETKLNNYWTKQIRKLRPNKNNLISLEKEIKRNYKGDTKRIREVIKRIHENENNIIHPNRFISQKDELIQYFQDLYFIMSCNKFSKLFLLDSIETKYNLRSIETLESISNYIDPSDKILRMGAIKSYKNKKVVILDSKYDKLYIGVGIENNYWNYSSPLLIDSDSIKSINNIIELKNTINIKKININFC